MQTKNSTSPVLIAIIVLVTFPIWIGIIGGLFGVMGGIIGGLFGIISGVFGAIFGMIGWLFGSIFGSSCYGPFGWWNGEIITVAVIVLIIVLAAKSRTR
jgi:hypothetical protein